VSRQGAQWQRPGMPWHFRPIFNGAPAAQLGVHDGVVGHAHATSYGRLGVHNRRFFGAGGPHFNQPRHVTLVLEILPSPPFGTADRGQSDSKVPSDCNDQASPRLVLRSYTDHDHHLKCYPYP
jgi:hypothetical protein